MYEKMGIQDQSNGTRCCLAAQADGILHRLCSRTDSRQVCHTVHCVLPVRLSLSSTAVLCQTQIEGLYSGATHGKQRSDAA